MDYDFENHTFFNHAYDSKAALLLEDMQNRYAGNDKLSEVERCLQLGCIRSDWLLDKNSIEEQIKKAKYTSDKNYWICMKKLSEMH